jgi:hypothetical protein
MKINQLLEAKKGVKAPKYATKPRNFVAKNMTTGGAGAHKDKKKAAKQGDVKHKNNVLAEGAEFGAYYYEKLAQELFDMNPNLDTSGRADEVLNAAFPLIVRDLGSKKRANNLLNYDQDFPSDFVSAYGYLQSQGQNEGIGDTISSVATKVSDALSSALPKEYRPFDHDTAAKNQQSMKIVKNEGNAEYDDEAGMADNNLSTLERAVEGIDDLISAGDNLPEWCQEKIAVAKSMLVTVWDYMKSEEQGVEEGMYRRPGSPSAYDRDYASSVSGMGKRDSLAYQLDGGANDERHDLDDKYQAPQDKPVLTGYYFYNVPAGKEQEAASYGIKQTKSSKWAKAKYNTSGRSFEMQKDMADKSFGPGKWWAPK